MLVREQKSGLQVYLVKRSARSAFFPGKYVFPGGTVDREDRCADFWLNHADLDREGIEKSLILPAGTPFSRIWLHEGIWRPVGL
jgi:hypothetical protein